ncbi:MAG TPA: type I DNA topoisomerase [Candidatus Eisenbacteria bacterium]|nr:type I DNA topoisomerase [Candidatus Eisenbacteria bacterium]
MSPKRATKTTKTAKPETDAEEAAATEGTKARAKRAPAAKPAPAAKARAKTATATKTGAKTKTAARVRPAASDERPATGRGRNLVIVESPAKARTIAKYLGSGFEVKASNGHVRDLPKSKLGVDVENGFEPSYVLIKGKGKILKDLKTSARRAATIYLAPDPDREGEAIAWHLAETLGDDANADKIRRLAFYEITKRGIEEALEKPRTIDMAKVQAQQARRVLDRLVGYKVSPFLWKTIRYGLSAGRVQSVALRLICERQVEIGKFVRREYWTVDADLTTPSGDLFRARVQKKNGEKFTLENEAQAKAEADALGRESFAITDVRTQEKKRNPVPPFITSTLQQESFRRHKYSGQKTMVIAQQLYEGIEVGSEGATGLITYMRTDSTRVAPDAIAEVRDFIKTQFGDAYLPAETRQYRSRETSQDAHEAVRPTSVSRTPASMRSYLDADQYKLYELIWQRFVASQMNPALVLTTTAEIMAGPYLLRASGSRVKFDGFARAYATALIEESGAEGASKLPAVAKGDALKLAGILPEQHFTEPPPHYTEATLVKVLEEKGIGRPSTYATIVGTILARDYVTRDRGKLVPTELGMTVWKLLEQMFADVFDVEFTAKLESHLDRIESGKDPWAEVVSEFYEPFRSDLVKAESQQEKVRASLVQETDVDCPKCGSKMVKRFGRSGPFLACPRYPECKATMPIEEEEGPTEVPTQKCPQCESAMRVRTGRFGKFLACSRYPECKGTRPFTLQIPCPKCGTGELVERRTRRGKPFYGCSRYPECDFGIWDKPVKQACPNCDSPLLVQKHSKTKGDFLQCPKCKSRIESEASEALSGTVDR